MTTTPTTARDWQACPVDIADLTAAVATLQAVDHIAFSRPFITAEESAWASEVDWDTVDRAVAMLDSIADALLKYRSR